MSEASAFRYTITIAPDLADKTPPLRYTADTAHDLLHAIARLNAAGRYVPADAAALACALHTIENVIQAYPEDEILAPLAGPVTEALRRLEHCTPPHAVFA
ncbi:hypothetical protein FXN63_17075 [Pigmentiphaga aceris]|uniref:DUF3861 domain-containing protein n=1 Tax=Pigmentiphaga aceris TaxID=1940612 RepID=A0A5C0B0Y7_9BURK|nr:hypothetical protein [Pigmentiphaga aceris]QEI07363.1 hypothetical protein FXN63_17075 [Pigmentiphaga aceris]